MAHFGYTFTKGIIGEVATTAPRITRSFIASERINFGQLVQADRFKPLESNCIVLSVFTDDAQLGVAAYQPNHPKGYYEAGDNVTVITEGDIFVNVKILPGQFRAGDKVYLNFVISPAEGDSHAGFSSTMSPMQFGDKIFGTFVEGGVGNVDNMVRIRYEPNHLSFI